MPERRCGPHPRAILHGFEVFIFRSCESRTRALNAPTWVWALAAWVLELGASVFTLSSLVFYHFRIEAALSGSVRGTGMGMEEAATHQISDLVVLGHVDQSNIFSVISCQASCRALGLTWFGIQGCCSFRLG